MKKRRLIFLCSSIGMVLSSFGEDVSFVDNYASVSLPTKTYKLPSVIANQSVQTKLDIAKGVVKKFVVMFSNPLGPHNSNIRTWNNMLDRITPADIKKMRNGVRSQRETYRDLKTVVKKTDELRKLKTELVAIYNKNGSTKEKKLKFQQILALTDDINALMGSIYGLGAPHVPIPDVSVLLESK